VLYFTEGRRRHDPAEIAARFERRRVLHACITSDFTREAHLDRLMDALNSARGDSGVPS